MCKKSLFRAPLDKKHFKHAQTLVKSASQYSDHIHWPLASKSCSKKCLILTWQILGLLVNTMAGDENYPVLNRVNLRIPIKIQLSEKRKTFSQFYAAFLKSRLNFEDFEKKYDSRSFCVYEISEPENVVR